MRSRPLWPAVPSAPPSHFPWEESDLLSILLKMLWNIWRQCVQQARAHEARNAARSEQSAQPSCPDVSSPAPTLICGLWQGTLRKTLPINL